jgi:tRNA threonylcarbamoyladenosine biosynthesis protein TsaB
MAFLKGLLFGSQTPVLPLSSLESLALAWPAAEASTVVAAFDARRGEVFWARFAARGHLRERMSEDTVCSAEAFAGALSDGDIVLTDTLGYARSTVFYGLVQSNRVFAVETNPVARGLACARAASLEPRESSRWTTAQDVMPVYLRPSYAEEKRAGQEAAA